MVIKILSLIWLPFSWAIIALKINVWLEYHVEFSTCFFFIFISFPMFFLILYILMSDIKMFKLFWIAFVHNVRQESVFTLYKWTPIYLMPFVEDFLLHHKLFSPLPKFSHSFPSLFYSVYPDCIPNTACHCQTLSGLWQHFLKLLLKY